MHFLPGTVVSDRVREELFSSPEPKPSSPAAAETIAATTSIPPRACVFTSLKPAWNDRNLARLAQQIRSTTILAHVRAAGPGSPVSDDACHPFEHRGICFMHNGMLGAFDMHIRELFSLLSDEGFRVAVEHNCIDSAVAFGLFITILFANDNSSSCGSSSTSLGGGDVGVPGTVGFGGGASTTTNDGKQPSGGAEAQPEFIGFRPPQGQAQVSTAELVSAMQKTISTLNRVCGAAPSLLNFVVTQGQCLVASRSAVG